MTLPLSFVNNNWLLIKVVKKSVKTNLQVGKSTTLMESIVESTRRKYSKSSTLTGYILHVNRWEPLSQKLTEAMCVCIAKDYVIMDSKLFLSSMFFRYSDAKRNPILLVPREELWMSLSSFTVVTKASLRLFTNQLTTTRGREGSAKMISID